MANKGKVYIIGAGPGDPELITVKGQRILQSADVVLFTDSLVNKELMALARPDAEVFGSAGLTLEEITAVLVEGALEGKIVARVHTGDPAVYGAVLEQMVTLNRMGIPYEIIPGVSSVFGAAAALGAMLTVPDLAQTVILTRMEGRTPVPALENLRSLAAHRTTMVLYLSVTGIKRVVGELIEGGYTPETPAAVVQRATWSNQKIVRGTLADIAEKTHEAGIRLHALIMVGQVFDPSLPTDGEQYKSLLYDKDFTHMFRRADGLKARDAARAKVKAAAEAGAAPVGE
jgi:precorrin-4/cobalt-precorrin-4 C11-methyltransferase